LGIYNQRFFDLGGFETSNLFLARDHRIAKINAFMQIRNVVHFLLMSQEFKYIVRVAGRDLDGTKKVVPAIGEIKGVGDSYANAMVASLKLDSKTRLGQLTDRQLQQIEQALKDPAIMNLPPWLLNRRKDIDSGSNIHRIGSDLDFMIKGDLDREKNVLSWRGIRHSLGLKVRGQRTRTTGRKGRTVGVKKSSLQAAQAAQAAASAEKK